MLSSADRLSVVLALALLGACAGQPAPEPGPPPQATCAAVEVVVRGAGSGTDGIGRFVASVDNCFAPRDTLVIGLLTRLLYTGIPESPQTSAMLLDPEGVRRNQPESLLRLLGPEGLQFIVEATPSTDGGTLFRINLSSLREWLVRNGLTRRFGLP